MLKKIVFWIILTSLLLQTSVAAFHLSFSVDSQEPLVFVMVHSSIYTAIESSLEQYAVDLEKEGVSVNIVETSQLQSERPQEIRSILQDNLKDNLVGALFVGDVPEVWFEVGNEKVLTDMYFKDLNGQWVDSDGDGVYDEHNGDVSPEIWVGRLKASTIAGDEVSLIRNYFVKNHRYRNGLLILPWWRSLVYIDDEGLNWTEEAELSLRQVNTEVTVVTDPATTDARDYESRLEDKFGYEWIYLMCHGSYDFHTFRVPDEKDPSTWGGTIFSWEYQAIDPRAFFYLLFVCSAAEYTKPGYLGGSAIFADTYGLATIGSTTEIFSISFLEFFTSLSEGKTIGNAFQEWFTEQHEENVELQTENRNQSIFYGLTIVGDPTLKLYRKQNLLLHDISITDVTTELEKVANKLTLSVTATIENTGSFTESFDFTLSVGSIKLTKLHLSLPAKASTTVEATVPQSYRIVPVETSKIKVRATASILPDEFNGGDNEEHVEVEGVHLVSLTRDSSPYPTLLAFVMVIVTIYALARIIVTENPPLSNYWTKMKNHLTKTLSKLRHKISI